jgi:hypothetical protein
MWISWWSFATVDLGLSNEQFYSLTPRMLHALRKRHERQQEHQDAMLAQLTSCLVNFSYRAPEKPTKWQDFMPGDKYQSQSSKKPRRLTKKRRHEIVQNFRSWFPRQK